MTTNNAASLNKTSRRVNAERSKWHEVKGSIIARFGTIAAAARSIKCHPNAIRLAVAGKCPEVARKLTALLA